MSTLRSRESAVIVAVQRSPLAPPLRPIARWLSFFGEHAAGWLLLGVVGAFADPSRFWAWALCDVAIVVAHGLSASGRYMSLRIPLPDRPGQLARVSELLAQVGANVIEVLHTRHGQGLQISEVILQLSVETRGAEHRALVIQTLEDAGFVATVVPD